MGTHADSFQILSFKCEPILTIVTWTFTGASTSAGRAEGDMQNLIDCKHIIKSTSPRLRLECLESSELLLQRLH